jgi:hypothetical protein
VNPRERIALIDRLRQEPDESEWIEFKENHNLLQELRRSGSIANQGTRSHPEWVIVEPPRD